MKSLFCLLFTLCLSCTAAGQRRPVVYPIPHQEQLPTASIHRFFQDSEGYMWIATMNGLCRYDGYNIRTLRADFATPSAGQNNLTHCIAEDTLGRLWYGTPTGLYILDKRSYTTQTVPEFDETWICEVFCTSDGSVYVTTDADTYLYGDTVSLGMHIDHVVETPHGTFAVARERGLLRRVSRRDFAAVCPAVADYAGGYILPDHDGLWIGTYGHGILYYNLRTHELTQAANDEETMIGFDMVIDDVEGLLWVVGGDDMLAYKRMGEGRLQRVPIPGWHEGGKQVAQIVKDRDGQLWVSAFDMPSHIITFGREGISRYVPTTVTPSLSAVCADHAGNVWLMQDRCGVAHLSAPLELRTASVNWWFVAERMVRSHTDGMVRMVSSDGRLLDAFTDPTTGQPVVQEKGRLPSSFKPDALMEDSEGRLWIGQRHNIYTYTEQEGVRAVAHSDGVAMALCQTLDGHVYAAFRGKGVVRLPDGELLPSPEDVTCLTCTTDGTLWAGTGHGEVFCLTADGTLTDHSAQAGMTGDAVDNIVADPLNHLWIVTSQSLTEYAPRRGAFRIFRATDPGISLFRFLPHAACMLPDGRLLFGGIGGMLAVTPSQDVEGMARPVRPIIADVRADGRSVIWSTGRYNGDNNIDILPSEQHIQIDFTTLQYESAANIRFRYRMEGIDRDWVTLPPGQNSAVYTHLPHGTYRIEVMATDSNGLWSEAVATFTLHRLPAWWQTWWMRLLYVLAAVVLAVVALSGYRYFHRKHSKIQWADNDELIKLNRYLAGREQEAKAAPDDQLLAQMTAMVEAHMDDPDFGVATMAEEMNMSRSTLTRKLKAVAGVSPADFIKGIRMHHAAHLLESHTASVSQAMRAVGYNDAKNFARLFREIYGVSPAAFRRLPKQ